MFAAFDGISKNARLNGTIYFSNHFLFFIFWTTWFVINLKKRNLHRKKVFRTITIRVCYCKLIKLNTKKNRRV